MWRQLVLNHNNSIRVVLWADNINCWWLWGLVAPWLGWLKPDTTGSSHSVRPASDFSTFPLISNIIYIPLCKMGGFLDLRPWKLEGNMISSLIENLCKPNDTASLLSFYKLSLETSRVLRFSQVSYHASYQVSCRFPWTQVQETSYFT